MVRQLEKTAQFTVRIPQELKDEFLQSAQKQDIDGVTWVRHAIREKLDRETSGSAQMLKYNKEELLEALRQLQKEGLVEFTTKD